MPVSTNYEPIQPKVIVPTYTPTFPPLTVNTGQKPATTGTSTSASNKFDFNSLLNNIFNLGGKFLDLKIGQTQQPGTVYVPAAPATQTSNLMAYLPLLLIALVAYFLLKK